MNIQITETNYFQIGSISIKYFNEMRKWAFFFAIIGFLRALYIAIYDPQDEVTTLYLYIIYNDSTLNYILLKALNVIIAILYFFPSYFLLMFSLKMKKAIDEMNNDVLLEAFRYKNMLFRFLGIWILTGLTLYLVLEIAKALLKI